MEKLYIYETFEEFAEHEGWGEKETTDEYAPYCKEYYERVAKIINRIKPFTDEQIEELGGPSAACDFFQCMDASIEWGCIDEETREELIDFFNDLDSLDDDIRMTLSFISDLFYRLYTYYLGGENLF